MDGRTVYEVHRETHDEKAREKRFQAKLSQTNLFVLRTQPLRQISGETFTVKAYWRLDAFSL